MKTIDKINLERKTVIVRCDLNVSLKNGKIIDDTKIKESSETINYILNHNGRAVIISHLGRVKEEKDKQKYTMGLIIDTLNKYLNNKIKFISSLDFKEIKLKVAGTAFGKGVLLENTRFYDLKNNEESSCSLHLAKEYASLGEIFINDAFGTIHRMHASNYGISKYLPSGVGLLVKKEIDNLNKIYKPEKPFMVIMGGSKVSDKIKIIEGLLKKTDKLFIGGAMAFTFLKASNLPVGKGQVEEEYLDTCKKLLIKYKDKILLPVDFNGSNKFEDVKQKNYYITDIPDDFYGMDIGKETISMLKDELNDIKTLFWNGPVGVYEFENYKNGTEELMKYITKNIKTSVIGGGDIIAAARKNNLLDKFTFASTGGGATLEYLINKKQPGLVNISR